MNFQVILESLRMANIISFTFREAVVDVEYKGKDVYNYKFIEIQATEFQSLFVLNDLSIRLFIRDTP